MDGRRCLGRAASTMRRISGDSDAGTPPVILLRIPAAAGRHRYAASPPRLNRGIALGAGAAGACRLGLAASIRNTATAWR
ncbi:hypothetical protein, partial [Burkholderia glumae]